jgi:hypothetical protein
MRDLSFIEVAKEFIERKKKAAEGVLDSKYDNNMMSK